MVDRSIDLKPILETGLKWERLGLETSTEVLIE